MFYAISIAFLPKNIKLKSFFVSIKFSYGIRNGVNTPPFPIYLSIGYKEVTKINSAPSVHPLNSFIFRAMQKRSPSLSKGFHVDSTPLPNDIDDNSFIALCCHGVSSSKVMTRLKLFLMKRQICLSGTISSPRMSRATIL
jgi:hypothetical protein